MFKSLVHFWVDFCAWYKIRTRFHFFFFAYGYQFSQYHLFKRLSCPCMYSWHLCWGSAKHRRGFISASLAMISWLWPNVQATETKIKKWECTELKNFRTTKYTTYSIKRQATRWEQIFANYIPEKKLIPQICKELIHLIKQKELIVQYLNRLTAWISPEKIRKWPIGIWKVAQCH